jgi:Domain of unknown function (DUF6265)
MSPIRAALAASLLAAAPAPATIGDLAWMAGRWETSADGRWTEETWSAPRAGAMIGYSRSGQGEAGGDYEFLRIAAGADGVPVYYGSPGGRPPVPFRLSAATANSATFDNPAHDFPQRIRYVRDGDSMVATISALDGSHAMRWTYRRQ